MALVFSGECRLTVFFLVRGLDGRIFIMLIFQREFDVKVITYMEFNVLIIYFKYTKACGYL